MDDSIVLDKIHGLGISNEEVIEILMNYSQGRSFSGRNAPNFKDLTGMMFGLWRVDEYKGTEPYKGSYWLCTCTGCGTQKELRTSALTSGTSRSCGAGACRKKIRSVDMDDQMYRRMRRVWANLIELGNYECRRCDENGNCLRVVINDPALTDWEQFKAWSLSIHGQISLAGETIYSSWSPYADLYVRADAQLYNGYPLLDKNALFWTSDPKVTISGEYKPLMKIEVGHNKLYLDPLEDVPMTRQQLCDKYHVIEGTFTQRMMKGEGLVRALRGGDPDIEVLFKEKMDRMREEGRIIARAKMEESIRKEAERRAQEEAQRLMSEEAREREQEKEETIPEE